MGLETCIGIIKLYRRGEIILYFSSFKKRGELKAREILASLKQNCYTPIKKQVNKNKK